MFYSFSEKKLKNKKVKLGSEQELSTEDVFLDKLARKKEVELGLGERKIEVPLSRNSLFYLYLLFLILIFILAGKTLWLQVFEHQKYLEAARENYQRIHLIRPLRGIIYDQNLKPLLENLPSFDLVLNKRELPQGAREREKILEEMADILGKSLLSFKKEIEETDLTELLILENIPHETHLLLETKIKELPGFFIEKNVVRNYLAGPSFSHLLGYTGKINAKELQEFKDYSISDYIGREGLEKSYEQILRGVPGKFKIEKDAFGKTIGEPEISKPQEGKNLALWLSQDLQKVLANSLKQGLERVRAQKGAALALNPKTGAVLALVSLPNFDNNLFSQGISLGAFQEIKEDENQPLFNRVIAGQYPTGSTIKPLIAAGALQENLIDPQKQILAQGYIEVPHQYNPEIVYTFRDWKVHGWTDMRKAIADSVNVYFYTIGGGYEEQKGLGVSRIKKYLQLFGWGQKTGIDLSGEVSGFLPDAAWKKEALGENWYIGNTYHLSIGQGYLRITPLQVAVATAVIANKGKLLQPQVVKAILDSQKEVIETKKPQVLAEGFIEPENLQIVSQGMREAVIYGSSKILNQLPVKVASKTGTAQTSKEGHYHHWVTIFAPYEDPEIVLTIVIEDVKGLQSATLPVAKEVLEWYFTQTQ